MLGDELFDESTDNKICGIKFKNNHNFYMYYVLYTCYITNI